MPYPACCRTQQQSSATRVPQAPGVAQATGHPLLSPSEARLFRGGSVISGPLLPSCWSDGAMFAPWGPGKTEFRKDTRLPRKVWLTFWRKKKGKIMVPQTDQSVQVNQVRIDEFSPVDILKKMQDVIKKSDLLKRDVPVSIGFFASGRVVVHHSLSTTPFFFDTVEMALKHIEEHINAC